MRGTRRQPEQRAPRGAAGLHRHAQPTQPVRVGHYVILTHCWRPEKQCIRRANYLKHLHDTLRTTVIIVFLPSIHLGSIRKSVNLARDFGGRWPRGEALGKEKKRCGSRYADPLWRILPRVLVPQRYPGDSSSACSGAGVAV